MTSTGPRSGQIYSMLSVGLFRDLAALEGALQGKGNETKVLGLGLGMEQIQGYGRDSHQGQQGQG